MNKDVNIIGVASGIGAELRGAELGVWDIYYHLKSLDSSLEFSKIFYQDSIATKLSAMDDIISLCLRVREYILATKKNKHLFFSGDHSNGFAIWSAMADLYNTDMGLIWVDAHLDCHIPSTTPSGNIHGMPMAHLLGFGEERLTSLIKNKYKPENICFIGTRDYESEELDFINKLGIKVFYKNDISKENIDSVFKEAVEHVSKNTLHFGVSLDIDNFDPLEAPATGCFNPDGLWVEEVVRNIYTLSRSQKFCGLEITEYNPLKDADNKTRLVIMKLVKAVLDL